MQSFLRGFLINCKRSAVPPPNTAAVATDDKKKPPPKAAKKIERPSSNSSLDIDKCFKVGYESVSRATLQLLNGLQTEPIYKTTASRLELCTRWKTLIRLMLMHDITKNFPMHNFVTEDKNTLQNRGALALTDEPTWFIEPIDGTMNFVHGFPYITISVGFWLNKQAEFSIIWNPMLDQCFTARRGLGCFLNTRPFKVTNRKNLKDALVLHELGTNSMYYSQNLDNLDRVSSIAHAVRSLGSTQLNMCMVAQGFADAYYEFGCHAWDVAPAALIVQEAGGVVLDPLMKPLDIMSRRMICASTHRLAEDLSAVLKQLYYSPRDDENPGTRRNTAKDEENDKSSCPKQPKQRRVRKKKVTRCPPPMADDMTDDPPLPGYGL